MMLSDKSIKLQMLLGDLKINPHPQDHAIQPASVDLTLDNEFLSPYADEPITAHGYYTLLAGECVLATTVEHITLPDFIVGRVEGKSSWGRRFLMVHSTAGFIDPGFRGQITLELKNLSKISLVLRVGTPIAQISFQMTDEPVERPYGTASLRSRYQDQIGVTAPRF